MRRAGLSASPALSGQPLPLIVVPFGRRLGPLRVTLGGVTLGRDLLGGLGGLLGRDHLGCFRAVRPPGNLSGLFLAVSRVDGLGGLVGFFAVGRRRLVFVAFGRRDRRRMFLRRRATLGGGLVRADRGEHVGVGPILVTAAPALRFVGTRAVD